MNKVKTEEFINDAMAMKMDIIEKSLPNDYSKKHYEHFDKFPKKLYKYAKVNQYSLDSIKNDYIYLCPANKLDDQFECRLKFNFNKLEKNPNALFKNLMLGVIDMICDFPNQLCKKELKKISNNILRKDGTLDFEKMREILINTNPNANIEDINFYISFCKMMAYGIEQINGIDYLKELIDKSHKYHQTTGIGSLTENKKSQIMWEMYGNHYKGICIEYEFIDDNFPMINILPVLYKNKDNFIITLTNIVLEDLIRNISNGKLQSYDGLKKYIELFLTKNKEWSFQKEWRIIGEAASKYKVKKIKSIYFGKNISKTNKEKIIKIAKKKGISLYEQIDDFDSLSIKYKKITII